MNFKEKAYENLRSKNLRITSSRKAIIDILEGNHLTLHEIFHKLEHMGHGNLSTLYNNIEFLLEHKIITKVYINDKTYYDLAIEKNSHNADTHVHVACSASNNIFEVNQEDILDKIKTHPAFSDFDISKLQVVVEGSCKHYDEKLCKNTDKCHIKH